MKLTEGKKRAIKNNRSYDIHNKKSKKSKKNPLDILEEKLLGVFLVVFGICLVIILICSVNKPDMSEEVPENYVELAHLYDKEQDEMEDVDTKTEKEDLGAEPTLLTEKRAISCWGDSYTVAPSTNVASYAGVISQLSSRIVYNIGSPLDSLKVIAGRQGGVPLVTTPFIIPADKTPVEIAVDSSLGGRMYIDFTKNAGLNPVKIAGVGGLISKMNDKLYFTRDVSGSQTMVLEPTEITTRGMELRRNDISVFFVGSDSSIEDPDLMLSMYKSMIEYLSEEDRAYLVVGPIIGDVEKLDRVDEKLSAEFGNKYLNLRKYLCYDVDEEFLKEFNDEEMKDVVDGIVPLRYFHDKDRQFFNQLGAEMAGTAIYERLLELGYFKN